MFLFFSTYKNIHESTHDFIGNSLLIFNSNKINSLALNNFVVLIAENMFVWSFSVATVAEMHFPRKGRDGGMASTGAKSQASEVLVFQREVEQTPVTEPQI